MEKITLEQQIKWAKEGLSQEEVDGVVKGVMTMIAQDLADLISKQTIKRLNKDNLNCSVNIDNAICNVKPGKKYTKIDQGGSGKYMIDADGNIFGIKAYGVIHKGHYYGTLDTINDYFWGDYTARKIN